MNTILCIDTGTEICSVSISKGGKTAAIYENAGGRDHARNVAVYTDELLRSNCIGTDELSAVAVAKGPGSYTGLRIGVSFAKGLCYSLGIPLIAVDSLESLARVAAENHESGLFDVSDWYNTLLCPMIDARRMEVYTEIFDTRFNSLSGVSAEIITEDSFAQYLHAGREMLIFGDGAAKTLDILPKGKVRLIDVSASSRGLCAVAEQKLRNGETEDVAYFEPFYLKDFVVTTSKKKIL